MTLRRVQQKKAATKVGRGRGARQVDTINVLEETEKDLGDECRICWLGADIDGKVDALFSPCCCTGSIRYIHRPCLRKWQEVSLLTLLLSAQHVGCHAAKLRVRVPEGRLP